MFVTAERTGAPGIPGGEGGEVEATDTAKHPRRQTEDDPKTESALAPNITSSRVEKPSYKNDPTGERTLHAMCR